MSEITVDNPKTFTQSEVEEAVRKRLDQAKQAHAQQLSESEQKLQAQAAELQRLRDSGQQAPPSSSSPQTGAPTQMPNQTIQDDPTQKPLTQADLDNYLSQKQAAEQESQNQVNALNHVKKAAESDKELHDLAFGDKAVGFIPPDYATTLVQNMGDDALPVIKEALSNSGANKEMLQHTDAASLIGWAHKKHAQLSNNANKPDSSNIDIAPDISGEGDGPADGDDEEIRQLVADTQL